LAATNITVFDNKCEGKDIQKHTNATDKMVKIVNKWLYKTETKVINHY